METLCSAYVVLVGQIRWIVDIGMRGQIVTNRLPYKYFRVMALDPVGYREVGSKSYADEIHARNHLDFLRRKGVRCDLYVTRTNWLLVDQQPELEGQEELF